MLHRTVVLVAVLSLQLLFLNAQSPEAESKRPLCMPNEVYAHCGNKCLEPKCDQTACGACIEKCNPGCYCTHGYARNQEGTCVPYTRDLKCPKPTIITGCTTIVRCIYFA
uniref:TIL domain-containing protein n=1 Tax=Anopheles funestus TaxID=62324 RepID=A0A4Y0BRG8_ANOFN